MPKTLAFPSPTTAARCAPALPRFTCTWRPDVGVGCVEVTGELDLSASPQLEQTLRKAQLQACVVVLDLRRLAFLDAAGMNVIVGAGIRARDDGRRLIVVRGPAEVDAVFRASAAADDVQMCDLRPMDPPKQALLQLARKNKLC